MVWAESVGLVEWAELAELAELEGLAGLVERAVSAVRGARAASVDPAVRGAAPSPARAVPRAAPAVATAHGIIIPSIEAVPPMEIGRRRTGLVAARAAPPP